jgi:hypothetical protein
LWVLGCGERESVLVDSILKDLRGAGSFNDDIKSVRILGLDLLKLSLRVTARERNIFLWARLEWSQRGSEEDTNISCTKLFSQIHL